MEVSTIRATQTFNTQVNQIMKLDEGNTQTSFFHFLLNKGQQQTDSSS